MIKIYPKMIAKDKKDLEALLAQEGIRFEENIDGTFGKYEDGRLIATASTYKNIIKCVAIDQAYKGGAVFNELMTRLLAEISEKGFDGAFVYTKPIYETSFQSIGFKLIERVGDELIFMQRARNDFFAYLADLEQTKKDGDVIGGVVMNANPFTLGHKYLIDYASQNSTYLYVFVLSEDESYFSAKDRFNMVKAGVSEYDNVILHPTENYLVSSATFPSYFIDEDKSITKIHASLDANIFKNHIAKSLGITKRFVGTEPHDEATRIYNETMAKIFALGNGSLSLVEIPRKVFGHDVISASRVRKLIADGQVEKIKDLVPQTTYDYIIENNLY